MRNKFIYLLLLAMFLGFQGFSEDPESVRKPAISGHVKDATSGEELIGATVYIKELGKGTSTNVYGFYTISVDTGNYTLVVSYMGYAPVSRKVKLYGDISIDIELTPNETVLEEVVITGQRKNENVTKAEMSTIKMDVEAVKRIPALFGEVDLVKAIQLLPGVSVASEGSSGFSVRGGSIDQNLVILDEATVYNASHLMGFFSVFNNDAVKDVTLYKGDIPAQYGGRLSSVLDVRMRDGNSKKFAAQGGIGTISSRLTVEGPIKKDKSSFLLSGRRTYADIFLLFSKREELKETSLYFYDFNSKFNYKFNENNRLYVSGYLGRDVFSNEFFENNFGNQTLTVRWNHLFSKQIFANFTGVYTKYDYALGTPAGEANSFIWTSVNKDHSVKADFSYFPNTNHSVKFGGSITYHNFDPGVAKGRGDNAFFGEWVVPENNSMEYGIYASNEQKIGGLITLKYGLRYSIFQNIGHGVEYKFDETNPEEYVRIDSIYHGDWEVFNTYQGLEPRLGLNVLINEFSSVKASYARTYQFVHLAQNSTAGTALDVWFPSSPNIKPQIADQYAIGYFRNFLDDRIETSIEGYYKYMDNAIDFKDHAQLLLNRELEAEIRTGEATSYGVEFLVRFRDSKLNGWVSYTYSKTQRTIPEINNGNSYAAPYDKPHDVAVVLNYDVTDRIIVSSTFVYYTGNPVTFPTGRATYAGRIFPIYSDRNEYRMPDYHRLDLSVTYQNKVKEGKRFRSEWNLSVYNVYNRHNAWSIQFSEDSDNPGITKAEKVYLFGILPSLTYNFYY
jgi:hypothetical protein